MPGTAFFDLACLLLWKWLKVFETWQQKWEEAQFSLVVSHPRNM